MDSQSNFEEIVARTEKVLQKLWGHLDKSWKGDTSVRRSKEEWEALAAVSEKGCNAAMVDNMFYCVPDKESYVPISRNEYPPNFKKPRCPKPDIPMSRTGNPQCMEEDTIYSHGVDGDLTEHKVECMPGEMCSKGMNCSNRKVQNMETSRKIFVGPTLSKFVNYGLFTAEPISKGEYIGEYRGRAEYFDEWCDYIKEVKAKRGQHTDVPYCTEELYAHTMSFGGDRDWVLDAYATGSVLRFANHSCTENCFIWYSLAPDVTPSKKVEWRWAISVFARKDIPAYSQITINYNWFSEDINSETFVHVRDEAMSCWKEDKQDLAELVKRMREGADTKSVTTRNARVKELYEKSAKEGQHSWLTNHSNVPEISTVGHLPKPLRDVYEKSGALRVGILCDCMSDLTLNASGRCSGVIGKDTK